jgi:hypothetical protein
LSGRTLPPGVDARPPATRGALTAALRAGYRTIGFIDGAIDARERLPLRELRDALDTPGVTLFGCASMGAIRAVQLESLGMIGRGRIYRLFRRGILADSDEVFVLHAPAALRYRCLTLPLVNIRYTLRAMRRAGHLPRADEREVIGYMRDVPWFDRDRHSLSAAVYAIRGGSRCTRFMQAFDLMYRDVKQEDALSLVSCLQSRPSRFQRSQTIGSMGIRSLAVRRA